MDKNQWNARFKNTWSDEEKRQLLAAIPAESDNRTADFQRYAEQLKREGKPRTEGAVGAMYYALTHPRKKKTPKTSSSAIQLNSNGVFSGEVRMPLKSIQVKDGEVVITF